MKKILSILAAISFTASVSSTVVACSSSKTSSSSKIKGGIDWGNSDEVVMTLSDGTKVRVGDFLKNNSSILDSYLYDDFNGLVANKYAENYSQTVLDGKNNLGMLNLTDSYRLQNPNTKMNGYADEVSNFSMVSSAIDLYRQYVEAYNKKNPLDEQYMGLDHLNPVWYKDSYGLAGHYSLWYKGPTDTAYKRWTTLSETKLVKSDDEDIYKAMQNFEYLPSATELTNDKFALINSDDMPTGYGNDPFDKSTIGDIKSLDISKGKGTTASGKSFNVIEDNLSGQQALLLRYQSTLQSSTTDSMLNALVMEYAKNTLYKMQSKPTDDSGTAFEKANDKSLYIDNSSSIAKDIQSWPTSGDQLVTSNYKMVWKVTVPNTDAVRQAVQTQINKLVDPAPLNSKLKMSDYSLVKDDGTGNTLANVMSKIITAGGNKNLAKNGADPYWAQTGYQGIVKDGSLVSGNALDLSQDAIDKIKNVEGLGILSTGTDSSSGKNYNFTSKDDQDDDDYVIVMPLYLMDLLRDGKAPTKSAPAKSTANKLADAPDKNTLSNLGMGQWIELNPQAKDATWKSTDKFTLTADGSKPDPVDMTKLADKLPQEITLGKANNKSYIFIPEGTPSDKSITLSDGGQTITVKLADPTQDFSGYGVKGVYQTTNDDAIQYNGQEVNYRIHLGIDNSNPDSYLNAWTAKGLKDENVNDIADLTNTNKTDLMNTLLASVAKGDTNLQEETKNVIYRNYVSLDDIYFKDLHDKLQPYLKEDDNTDDSD